MTYQRTQPPPPPNRVGLPQRGASLLAELARSARLVWRLLRDPRVATITKVVVPVLTAAYVLSPVDFLPDVVPALGQLDDLAILLLGTRLFIELCPPDIVRQHLEEIATGRPTRQSDGGEGEVVEGEYRIIE